MWFPPISNLVLSLPAGIGVQRGNKAQGLNYSLSARYFSMTNTGSNKIQHISLNLAISF